jgi:hypothetical protein
MDDSCLGSRLWGVLILDADGDFPSHFELTQAVQEAPNDARLVIAGLLKCLRNLTFKEFTKPSQ